MICNSDTCNHFQMPMDTHFFKVGLLWIKVGKQASKTILLQIILTLMIISLCGHNVNICTECWGKEF